MSNPPKFKYVVAFVFALILIAGVLTVRRDTGITAKTNRYPTYQTLYVTQVVETVQHTTVDNTPGNDICWVKDASLGTLSIDGAKTWHEVDVGFSSGSSGVLYWRLHP